MVKHARSLAPDGRTAARERSRQWKIQSMARKKAELLAKEAPKNRRAQQPPAAVAPPASAAEEDLHEQQHGRRQQQQQRQRELLGQASTSRAQRAARRGQAQA